MENRAYETDPSDPNPPPYSEFSLIRDEMEALRRNLDPGTFNAVLNHGEMTLADRYKLFFLIAFPTFFFILSLVLMGADES